MAARLAVFMNSRSGSALERGALTAALERAGITADIHDVQAATVSAGLAALADGHEVLVAAGGDGTVSAVASVAAASGKTLAVIPAGTSNHFARDAGIPLDLESAVALLAGGTTRKIDVGVVNDRIFLNNASLGVYPRMVWERNVARQRGLPRPVASTLAIVDTWLQLRNVTVRLVIDTRELVRRTPFVVVGNGEYEVEGTEIGRRRTLSDGQLSLYVAPGLGRVDALALPVRALLGRLKAHQKFEAWAAAAIRVDTPAPDVTVALDGEIIRLSSPLRFNVRPAVLSAILPADTVK